MKIIKPRRIRHAYTQAIGAPPERIFPMLCPVRETDWAPGWDPKFVISESGVMEDGCLFVTPEAMSNAIWITVRHDPDTYYLELLKVVPEHTVCKYEITLASEPRGRTAAEVVFTCTALSEEGVEHLGELTESWYEELMVNWEQALNYYLEHGTMISTVSVC
jgi:hypothetical protein